MATTSIKEVAERAGVSVGTVSNVLNRPELVSATTRQRVVSAIDELGFVRNEAARSLRAGRSRTVGLVVLDVGNPFFTDVGRGVEEVVEEHGSVLTFCNSGEDLTRQGRHLDHLEEQRVQGLLITPVDAADPRLDQLVERGVPVVLVDRNSGRDDRCSVAVDDVRGGTLAAEHLVEQGHLCIAFVGGPLELRQVAERQAGAQEVVAGSRGCEPLLVVSTSSLTVAAGRLAGEQLAALPRGTRPTGVFCGNDLLALGVLQALTTAGLGVPKDMAIVGYDDIDFAAAAAVPLSSVRQPREELGRAAADLLFDELEKGASHRHQQVVFQPELVVRASSTRRRATRRTKAKAS